jgi:DNA-binding SARP family transcriptional activator
VAVEFRVLGQIEALVNGQALEVGHARQQSVLAVLLIEANCVVAVDQLVDRIWDTAPAPKDPRSVLRTYLWRLRRALAVAGGIALVRHAPGYKLVVEERHVDVHRFRGLLAQAKTASDDDQAAALIEQALGLWRGEPFAGLDFPWVNNTRQNLLLLRQTACLDLNDIHLRQGRHASLLAGLMGQAAEHSLDERIAGQLMLALYRSGRQADALGHYQRIRRQLADELGADPGHGLQELHQRILNADPALAAPVSNLAASQTRPAMVPHQLPAAPRLFAGRERDLGKLTRMLNEQADSGNAMTIFAICGAAGIGKTWLALQWAHQHADRFPDGQLYIDLRGIGRSGKPMTPQSAVRGFLDALGVAALAVPAGLNAQVGLYRSLLADKRMLIVLDNARHPWQVAPLLPGSPTCTTLVTSRRRLTGLVTGHGAVPVDLGPLDDDEARNLLIRHFGKDRAWAEPDAVSALVEYCAGLPLALSIMAARAMTHPGLPLTALADELRDASTRLDALETADMTASLRTSLSWSYDALAPAAARALCLLALAPGPDIGLPAAATLFAQPIATTRALLRGLDHASLLQEHTAGRYRMHDLVRLYARDRAAHDHTTPGEGAALRRVMDF